MLLYLRDEFLNKDNILKDVKDQSLLKIVKNIIFCNKVRFFFILQCSFWIYYVTGIGKSYLYTLISILLFIILLDAIYVSVFRNGIEYVW